jgi:hypothetical protein
VTSPEPACRDCGTPLRSGSVGFCAACDESWAREGGNWQSDEVVLGWRGEGSTPRVKRALTEFAARRSVEDEGDGE